jgi:serine-type D-Ala-D-Ala carboxypeptidase/endopeptidase (penicillin-binding protein 4)
MRRILIFFFNVLKFCLVECSKIVVRSLNCRLSKFEFYRNLTMQKYSFLLLLHFIACSVLAQNSVQRQLNDFVRDKSNQSATISFQAIELTEGDVIARHGEKQALTCASTTKLFSTATAIELLGKDYCVSTKIFHDGFVRDSVLFGNLWIRGVGDVSMGSKFFNVSGEEFNFLNLWSQQLKAAGINRVQGAIIADASDFGYEGVPEGWSWGDVGNYYGAPAMGINLYDNQIKLIFQTGKAGTSSQITQIFPNVQDLKMKNEVKAGNVKDDNSIIYGAPFSLDRYVLGQIPAMKNEFVVRGSMPDPEFQLAFEWTKKLKDFGIHVSEAPIGFRNLDMAVANRYGKNFTYLFEESGKTVQEIAYWTNMRSVNMYAEGLLNWLSYADKGKSSTSSSLKILEKFWSARMDINGMFIKDGSGLSRSNAISAKHFCDLLEYMYCYGQFDAFKETLPVAGVSGTLKSLCKGQPGEGKIFAKSGTISRVKSYSGYVYAKSGKVIAFAFIVSNYNASSAEITAKMEKVLNALATY